MARISTYTQDSTVSGSDRLLGTDAGTGAAGTSGVTRNFPLSDLRDFFIGGDLTVGMVPIYNSDGNFSNSQITQTEGGQIMITGGLMVAGDIVDEAGVPLIDDIANEAYITEVYRSSATLAPFSVNVFTATGVYNLPPMPPDGIWVKIVNLSGVSNVILNAGTNRFMNTAQTTLQLDDQTASFELVYVNKPLGNAPVGWVIVGAN